MFTGVELSRETGSVNVLVCEFVLTCFLAYMEGEDINSIFAPFPIPAPLLEIKYV